MIETLPRLVMADGEIVDLVLEPVTVEVAGERLPRVIELSRAVARLRGFYEGIVGADMRARGATARRSGAFMIELRPEATWTVDDPGALFALLTAAYSRNEITRDELGAACQQEVAFHFDHGRLNTLAKRVPEINTLRRRTEGEGRLRVVK